MVLHPTAIVVSCQFKLLLLSLLTRVHYPLLHLISLLRQMGGVLQWPLTGERVTN